MRFKRKATEVEAEQFRDSPLIKTRGVCREPNETGCPALPHVHTIHANQAVVLKDCDWVIPEKDGVHFYPVDNAIFLETYEPA